MTARDLLHCESWIILKLEIMGINQDFKNNLAWNKQEKISENASSNLSEILCFSLFILESTGAIMQTQTPCSLSVIHGETASIFCRASQSIQNRYGDNFLHWYVQKSSQSPQLLIYRASNWESWVPDRFTSSGWGTDFILIISRVEAEDAGVYYCQQSLQAPPTVVQPQI